VFGLCFASSSSTSTGTKASTSNDARATSLLITRVSHKEFRLSTCRTSSPAARRPVRIALKRACSPPPPPPGMKSSRLPPSRCSRP